MDPEWKGASNPADEREFSPSECDEYNSSCCDISESVIYKKKWWCHECLAEKFIESIERAVADECSVNGDLGSSYLESCMIEAQSDDDECFNGEFVIITPSNYAPRVVCKVGEIE